MHPVARRKSAWSVPQDQCNRARAARRVLSALLAGPLSLRPPTARSGMRVLSLFLMLIVDCCCSPAGSYSASAGSLQCAQCLPGTVQAQSGQVTTHLCSTSTSTHTCTHLQTSCEVCPAGTYANEANGDSPCTPCTPGQSHVHALTHSCTQARTAMAMQHKPALVAQLVSVCALVCTRVCLTLFTGSYSAITGATVCELCSPGRAQNMVGQSSCTR